MLTFPAQAEVFPMEVGDDVAFLVAEDIDSLLANCTTKRLAPEVILAFPAEVTELTNALVSLLEVIASLELLLSQCTA